MAKLPKPQEKSPAMSAEDFGAFCKYANEVYGWSMADVGKALGCGVNEPFTMRKRGAKPAIRLACAALVLGAKDWKEEV